MCSKRESRAVATRLWQYADLLVATQQWEYEDLLVASQQLPYTDFLVDTQQFLYADLLVAAQQLQYADLSFALSLASRFGTPRDSEKDEGWSRTMVGTPGTMI